MVPQPWVGAYQPSGDERLASSEADWVLYARPQPKDGLSLVSARRLSRDALFI